MLAQSASATPRIPIAIQATGRVADLVSARTHSASPPKAPASTLNRAANLLLAAALILGVSTGIWHATGGVDLGFGDDSSRPPTIPFGGIVTQDENGDVDPADLPTAEDCTVEPLTIDEVIWYIQSPLEALYSTDLASPGPLPTEVVPATPPATNPPNFEPRPATLEELAGAAETQRMLMACTLADSYFQIWALFDPFWVRDFIMAGLPPLTGEDEARAMLQELEETGTTGDGLRYGFGSPSESGFLGIFPDGGAELLDTDPANSWAEAEGYITAGYVTYDADGTVLMTTNIFDNRFGTPVPSDEFLLTGGSPCFSYSLIWNEPRSTWLVTRPPFCG